MDRLNTVIGELAYILDSLRVLKNIYDSGSCNDCPNRECECKPRPGMSVRYNCPFYWNGGEFSATDRR